jgi:hypothetical protein
MKQSFTDVPDSELLKRRRDFSINCFCFQEMLNMLNSDIHVHWISDFTNILEFGSNNIFI